MVCSGAYRRYMAISDVREYAHLTADDVEAIGEELEAIRQDVVDSLGDRDRRRQWPKLLWAGGPLPWTADEVSNSTRQALYAR